MIEACHAAGYRLFKAECWEDLEAWQQRVLIGHFVLKQLVEGHQQEASWDKVK